MAGRALIFQRKTSGIERLGRLLFVLLFVFAACKNKPNADGSKPGNIEPEEPRVLVLGALREPDVLDPLYTEVSAAREPLACLYRDLTRYDQQWQIQPDLAVALPQITTSSVGVRSYHWVLRSGLKWSDGRPIQAADVKFGHEFESDPKNKAPGQNFASSAEIRTSSLALAFKVRWPKPRLAAMAPRNHAVLPRHSYAWPQSSTVTHAPVVNGPYLLDEWVRGQHLSLRRNPLFSGARPYFDVITWRYIGSEEAIEAHLKTGAIDAMGESSGLSLQKAEQIKKRLSATHEFHFVPSGVWLHLDLRLDHPALRRLAVRRAIHLAIDRKVLAQLSYAGRAEPAASCFSPQHPGTAHPKAPALELQSARELIHSAKLSASDKELELQFASQSQSTLRSATYLQAQLAKIGLVVKLKAIPFRYLFARMREGKHSSMSLYAWRTGPAWDGRSVFHSEGVQNFTGFKDEKMDALYEEMARADPALWPQHLRAIESHFLDRLPVIPLLFRQSVSVRPRGLENWKPTGTQTPVTWNAESWRFP